MTGGPARGRQASGNQIAAEAAASVAHQRSHRRQQQPLVKEMYNIALSA